MNAYGHVEHGKPVHERTGAQVARTALQGNPGASGVQPFRPEIWIADGPVVPFFSFPYSTRMAVIRLSDGSLLVWSPTALTKPLRDSVEALGPVRHLVSPNALHHVFLKEWTDAYPTARLYAPPRLRRKREDLQFDADLGDMPEPTWLDDVEQVVLRGSFYLTEIVFFHRPSRTILFADAIQNFPRNWFTGWRRIVCEQWRDRRPKSRHADRLACDVPQPPNGASRS